jgi:hypothetical protein
VNAASSSKLTADNMLIANETLYEIAGWRIAGTACFDFGTMK